MGGFTGTIPSESLGSTIPNTDQTGNAGISIRSIRRSDEDSKVNLKLLAMLAVVGIAIYVAAKVVWGYQGDSVSAVAPTALPYTDITPVVEQAPTVFAAVVAPTVTPTPVVIYETVVQTVTEYVTEYIPYEVERIVTLEAPTATPTIEPTATPLLADGVVRVCVDASGVKELYVSGHGVVGGGCHTVQVGQGSTYIEVQVNR